VSFYRVDATTQPVSPHPKVSKKDETLKRLARLPSAVRRAFWDIDSKLLENPGVEVTYGGKNLVRYRTREGCFREGSDREDFN
jgi:hypothetical protein